MRAFAYIDQVVENDPVPLGALVEIIIDSLDSFILTPPNYKVPIIYEGKNFFWYKDCLSNFYFV